MKPFTMLLVAAALGTASLSAATMEPNSFLDRPAENKAQFMSEIRSDHQVMDRYMRHFRMTQDQVLAFMSGLHLSHLDQDYSCTQYSVPKDGALRSHQSLVKKGEAVLEDATGTPIIRLRCGNPLTGPSLPQQQLVASIESAPAGLVDLGPQVNTVSSDLVALSLPPVPTLPEITTPTPPPPAPVTPTVGGGGNGDIALLALGAGFFHGGGGGGDHQTPVPEPASVATLAVGAITLFSRRRR